MSAFMKDKITESENKIEELKHEINRLKELEEEAISVLKDGIDGSDLIHIHEITTMSGIKVKRKRRRYIGLGDFYTFDVNEWATEKEAELLQKYVDSYTNESSNKRHFKFLRTYLLRRYSKKYNLLHDAIKWRAFNIIKFNRWTHELKEKAMRRYGFMLIGKAFLMLAKTRNITFN